MIFEKFFHWKEYVGFEEVIRHLKYVQNPRGVKTFSWIRKIVVFVIIFVIVQKNKSFFH